MTMEPAELKKVSRFDRAIVGSISAAFVKCDHMDQGSSFIKDMNAAWCQWSVCCVFSIPLSAFAEEDAVKYGTLFWRNIDK